MLEGKSEKKKAKGVKQAGKSFMYEEMEGEMNNSTCLVFSSIIFFNYYHGEAGLVDCSYCACEDCH